MVNDRKTPSLSKDSSLGKATDTMVADETPSLDVDVERASESSSSQLLDPFQLRDGLLTEREIATLRHRAKKGKRVARFHKKQNDLITSLLKPMEDHTAEARAEEDDARLPTANLVATVYAAISSGSLSLLATGIDSVFDIGSNILLFWLHRKAERLDVNRWPVGGARLETIGNIIYERVPMGSVNLVVIVEAVRSIVTKENNELQKFHLPSIIAVAVALGVKFILFVYSFSLRSKSSQVRVLWEDHRNDLWINGFGNTFVPSRAAPISLHLQVFSCQLAGANGGGVRVSRPQITDTEPDLTRADLDPMGAIIIALGVIVAWGRTIYGEFELLAGKSAPHDFLQLLIYKAVTFSEEIVKVDTVRAYHDYFVEVDVVMDANTPLWKAHDLSQQLQDKIEVLPNVERAFVHVDHETTHVPKIDMALPSPRSIGN
ncbi:hypothetical protein DXG01_002117 [Tephrocybe rancida]|nr:hypothetical protein DXG01_002117 [Tephrocybe rancida]